MRSSLPIALCLLLATTAAAEPLPEPLTLDQALAALDEAHPQLVRATARRERAAADGLSAEAATAARLDLEARARWVDPSSLAADQEHEDHLAILRLSKPLFDFGRSAALEEAAAAASAGAEQGYLDARLKQRLEVMEKFFAVLLADVRYARDNEELAVVYVSLDKLRDRHELGQVSDIELLEKESRFQQLRRQVRASEAEQRLSRARLALALNRPGELPSELIEPALPGNDRELPPLEELLEVALQVNPAVAALRREVEAATARVKAAAAEGNPRLSAELESAAYQRKLGGRDPWRAGLVLEVPLYDGGRVQAKEASRRADLKDLQARLMLAEQELRLALREQWERIQVQRVQRDEARALDDYRELYLDRSRALYELEFKTDLGDSMVGITEARLQRLRTEFELALAWARLDALLGRDPPAVNE